MNTALTHAHSCPIRCLFTCRYGTWNSTNWLALPLIALTLAMTIGAQAATPSLLWAVNIGAKVFDVDTQTNVYASDRRNVILLSGDGLALRTNSYCPVPGMARRDAENNFYFAGSFDGTQNFGGITLVGGWVGWPLPGHWTPGFPTCYLAKYAGSGELQWVSSWGQQSAVNSVFDMLLAGSNGVFVGSSAAQQDQEIVRFDSSGEFLWNTTLPASGLDTMGLTLGGQTSSNCCTLGFRLLDHFESGCRIDMNGSVVPDRLNSLEFIWNADACTNGTPMIDDQANAFEVGVDLTLNLQVLKKIGVDGSELLKTELPAAFQWALGRDLGGNLYLAGTNGAVGMFTTGGSLIWSNNFGAVCIRLTIDSSGNRFLSFADGTVGRLEGEAQETLSLLPIGLHSDGFHLAVASNPGTICRILVSTNLANWDYVGTVTNETGQVPFTDTAAVGLTHRFYRASR